MSEVFVGAPEFIETETQFEEEFGPEFEDLLFPKLDGILFPIVVANAEVAAPCPWMGGAEVTLTEALNNYYQVMTEENADEIIADVAEFLANRVELRCEEKEEVEQQPPLVQEEEFAHEEAERDEESPIDTPQRQMQPEPESNATIEENVPAKQKQMETLAEPEASDVTGKVEETAELITENTDIQEGVAIAEMLQDTGYEMETREELPSPPRTVQETEEVIAEPVELVLPAATEVVAVSEELKLDPRPGIETADQEDTDVVTTSPAEVMEAVDEPSVETDDVIVTAEVAAEPFYDEILDINEHAEMGGVDDAPAEPLAYHEAEKVELTETGEIELPADEVATVVEKIDELLIGVEDMEATLLVETMNEVVAVVDEVSESFEIVETEELPEDEEVIREKLMELYAALLENMPTTRKTELVELLTRLTLGRDERDESLEKEEEETSRGRAHKKIKALATIVKAIKKASNRVFVMARAVLRWHIINFSEISKNNKPFEVCRA